VRVAGKHVNRAQQGMFCHSLDTLHTSR
jgi:hypothetical protein